MRKIICVIIVLSLIASVSIGFADALDSPIQKTELRTGVIFAWKNTAGIWQKGIEPEAVYNNAEPTTVDLKQLYPNCTIRAIAVNPYNGESLERVDWYPNQIAVDTESYQRFYLRNAVMDLLPHNQSDEINGVMSYTYSGTLTAQDGAAVDVKYYLAQGMADEVYSMLGVTRESAPTDIKRAMEELYPVGGQSANVEGYLYFVPILRSYEILPATRPLRKPMVDVECGDPAAQGSIAQVGGVIKNTNDYDVGMSYTLTVNGTTMSSNKLTLKAGRAYIAKAPYKVSSNAKPGSKLRVVLTATIWDPLNPTKTENGSDTCDKYIILADDNFDGDGLRPSQIVD